jgi:hypothetical protein
MVVILFILAIVFLYIAITLHKSADKLEAKFRNRPSVINNPSIDLFTNEKYAIINILAFALGASSVSAFSGEANMIIEKWLSKLGMSKKEMEKSVRFSMNQSPDRSIQLIRDSLVEIKDKDFVRLVYNDVEYIAHISGDQDTIILVEELFDDILTH